MSERKPRLCLLVPSHWSANLGGAEMQASLLLDRLVELDTFDLHYMARNIDPAFRADTSFLRRRRLYCDIYSRTGNGTRPGIF